MERVVTALVGQSTGYHQTRFRSVPVGDWHRLAERQAGEGGLAGAGSWRDAGLPGGTATLVPHNTQHSQCVRTLGTPAWVLSTHHTLGNPQESSLNTALNVSLMWCLPLVLVFSCNFRSCLKGAWESLGAQMRIGSTQSSVSSHPALETRTADPIAPSKIPELLHSASCLLTVPSYLILQKHVATPWPYFSPEHSEDGNILAAGTVS